MTTPTDVGKFIEDLYGGVFEEKLGVVLSVVADAVTSHNKSGSVKIELDFKQIGASNQVNIKHKITYKHPTMRGEKSENDLTETPMHVNPGGELTLFPKNQGQMFPKPDFTKQKDIEEV